MNEYMPIGEFEWVEPPIDGLDTLTKMSNVGRIYEINIFYPQHIHDLNNDLPFLSKNGIPTGSKIQKLMATLEKK